MALKYILGSSGCGKTSYCVNEIIKSEVKGNKGIFIVPEQFTLESERLLIEASQGQAMLHTQVLSFKRLAYRLSEEMGGVPTGVLTAQGKTMLLRKIVFQLADKLQYFNKVIDKQGFLEQLNLIIREFFQYNITPEILENIANNSGEDNLKVKLNDLSIIFQAYIEYIKNYMTDEQQLTLICDKVGGSKLINDAEIWLDGFTGFTPQELSVIRQLLLAGKNVTISLITDTDSIDFHKISDFDPYHEAKSTIKKLNKIAGELKVPILPPVYLSRDMRHKENKELSFMKKAYFSYLKYEKPVENIEIHSCTTMYSEVNVACSKIIELVKNNGYRFDDIAVVIGSENYEKPLKTAFDKYNIPNFIDSRVSVMAHPLTDFILSLFEIVNYNFSYRAVCRCLKSGMLNMDYLDVAMLENYILANGIKGYKWFYEKWKYATDYDLERINCLKEAFLNDLAPFVNNIKSEKNYTVREISTYLFEILSSVGVTDTLNRLTKETESFDKPRAVIHLRVWDTIVALFDKMVEILGDEQVTALEYYKILVAGLNSCEMGFIPPTQDHIIVGDSTRTRLPEIKAMIVLGVTEGNLPKYVKDIGVLSDSDREFITSQGFEVAPDNRQRLNLDRLAIFMTLAKPTEKLYLFYPTGNINNDKCRPSSIIHKFKSMFSELSEKNCENELDLSAPEPAFEQLAMTISSMRKGAEPEEKFNALYNWFKLNPEYANRIEKLQQGILSDVPVKYLDKEILEQIYGDKLYLSVSRLKEFAYCPFSFLLKYVIKASQREEYKLYSSLSLGNIYHEALRRFSESLEKMTGTDWRFISKEDINEMISVSVDKTVQKLSSDIMLDTGKFQYAIKRVKDYLNTSVWALSEHIKGGRFKPAAFELSFGIDGEMPAICYELEDGKEIYLNGKIDRVDVFNYEGKQYIKVIDYKTSVNYSLDKIYHGLDPQLILYLDALVKNQEKKSKSDVSKMGVLPIEKGAEPVPAGMFYFGIDNPLSDDKNDPEKDIMEKFDMKGLLLNDGVVLKALDLGYDGKGLNSIIASNYVNAIEFDAIREHSVQVAKNSGAEILKGNVDILPYKYDNKCGCDYCDFSSVCRIDTLNRKDKYRNLDKMRAKEILKELLGDNEE